MIIVLHPLKTYNDTHRNSYLKNTFEGTVYSGPRVYQAANLRALSNRNYIYRRSNNYLLATARGSNARLYEEPGLVKRDEAQNFSLAVRERYRRVLVGRKETAALRKLALNEGRSKVRESATTLRFFLI